MNINKVHYTYLAPGVVRKDNVTIIADTREQVCEAFDALYQGNGDEGRFYVVNSIETIALGELF